MRELIQIKNTSAKGKKKTLGLAFFQTWFGFTAQFIHKSRHDVGDGIERSSKEMSQIEIVQKKFTS